MDDYKQFLDFEGLQEYDALIKQYIETGSIADLRQILGEVETKVEENQAAISNLKDYVDIQYNSIQSIEQISIDNLFDKGEIING